MTPTSRQTDMRPESETSASPMLSAKDWIPILFKEYDTLRAEILARVNNSYQLHAVASGLIGLTLSNLLAKGADGKLILAAVTTFAAPWFLLWLSIHRMIRRCARRLQEIEGRINELAGADLLRWESHWGLRGRGYLGSPRLQGQEAFRKQLQQQSTDTTRKQ